VRRAAVALLLSSACALPVVSAGNYLPAGDLQPGDFHVSVSMEAARVLAAPSDVGDATPIPSQAQQYEVSTWFASDISLRWQVARRVTLEGQLKLTNPISPFAPELVGGSLGARVRLLEHPPEGGLALELGLRVVGISAEQELDRAQNGLTQSDIWDYRAVGIEAPLIVTYRINSLVAVTGSPFLRAYDIRTWHTQVTPATRTQTELFWTPVLSGGFAGSFAFDLGPRVLAPGNAVGHAPPPGEKPPTQQLLEPGVSGGMRL
jgi:hypothetical protein